MQAVAVITMVVVLWRELADLFRDNRYRSVLLWMGILLVVGMFFYSSVEGWSLLDSLYFCVVTLGTVGYGDLSPTTPGSKIFTIAYVMLGLSFFVTFVSLLTKDRERIFERREQEIDEKRKPQAGDQPAGPTGEPIGSGGSPRRAISLLSLVVSPSLFLNALTVFSPPKPPPITTTWCCPA